MIFISRTRLSGDLSLKCHEIYFSLLALELRLSGSPVPHAGRVELRIKGIWGTIFGYYWAGGGGGGNLLPIHSLK